MNDRVEGLLKTTLPDLNVHITAFKLAVVQYVVRDSQ
jgi:hypothetical protein